MKILKNLIQGLLLGIGNSIPNAKNLHKYRLVFYRAIGVKIGENTNIVGPLLMPVDGRGFIEIGSNTRLNALTRFGPNGSGIRIGNQCRIGPRVSFECGGHSIFYDEKVGRSFDSKEIIIEDQVWIGANAVILQGVVIGQRSVVAAGAVVTKSIPPDSLWGGVPAKEIKKIKYRHCQ